MTFQEAIYMLLFFILAIYGFIIGAFTFGLIKIMRRRCVPAPQPTRLVSVIIPVRNEEDNIIRLLEGMLSQDFPAASLEVIVADDYSEDATMFLAGSFADRHPGFPLKLLYSLPEEPTAAGKKRAIERAVAMAKGEILLLTDADTGRGPGWISSMVSCFSLPGIQMVLGPVYFIMETNLLQKIQSLEFMGLMGSTAGSAALGYPVMCNGANLAYTRDAFFQTGGFSGNITYNSGDDQFMMSAVRKHFGKGSVFFNPDPLSRVSTRPEPSLAGFLNQRIRWVSKSRGYRDRAVISVGAVTWSTHFLLLAGMLSGFFFPGFFFFSLFLWLVKIVVEFPMVWLMIRYFGKKELTGYYFIAQVFQLLYVPLAGILGLFLPYRWKGRGG